MTMGAESQQPQQQQEQQQQNTALGKTMESLSAEAGLGLGEFRELRARWQMEEEETIALLRSLVDSLPVDESNCQRRHCSKAHLAGVCPLPS